MSERKTTLSIYATEKWIQTFLDAIGFSDNLGKSKSENIIECIEKTLFYRRSPAPLLPSGEQSPTVETETALETQSPLAFAQEHPCPYRTLGNMKGNADETQVLCAETDKLPLAACITRQKRYLHFEHSCQPLAKQRILEKMTKPQRQQPTTRAFKGNDYVQEGVLPRFYCPDGHTPSFCHGGNSCDKRLTCPEMKMR